MCDHLFALDEENPTGAADTAGRRFVHLKCTRCNERLSKLTTKSNRELAAELDMQ